jgi:hypothetical protein
MWKAYQKVLQEYPKIPLAQERLLIAKAQTGSEKCIEEIVLRHIGFVVRIFSRTRYRFCIRKFKLTISTIGIAAADPNPLNSSPISGKESMGLLLTPSEMS